MFVMSDLWGAGNPWHQLEDVTHTFASYAISGLDGETTQVSVGPARSVAVASACRGAS